MKTQTWKIKPSNEKAAESYTISVPETLTELVTWCGDNGEAIVCAHAIRNMRVDFASKVRPMRNGTDDNAPVSHANTVKNMADYRPALGRISQSEPEKQASAFSKMDATEKAAYLTLIGVDVKAS